MTLHETVEFSKKGAVGTSIGIVLIMVIVILFRVGIGFKNVIFPPKVEPPTHQFGQLPPIEFPASTITGDLTYSIQTVIGSLPSDFPDRLNVYQINKPEQDLTALDQIKRKIVQLGFMTTAGTPPDPIHLDAGNYEWDENNTVGLNRKIIFDIISSNFKLTSNYISQRAAIEGDGLIDKPEAILMVNEILQRTQLMPEDIDLDKTKTPDKNLNYLTDPQYFSIRNSTLIPETSFANTKVLRVDLYQKNLQYKLNTGVSNNDQVIQTRDMDIPIVYPHPPNSTMSFWIAATDNGPEIVQANFTHQDINIPVDGSETTYAIKTPEEALTDLKSGKGYIAAYFGDDKEIRIDNVYLAYYMGETTQDYLLPVIVFEGQNGFIAYVSAVRSEWLK